MLRATLNDLRRLSTDVRIGSIASFQPVEPAYELGHYSMRSVIQLIPNAGRPPL